MRNFKKFLALVLAMLMVSACAVSVSAFTDDGAVRASGYAEAINALADLGVLKGNEAGAFNPNGTLRRDEAAVIAAKLVAGAKGQSYDWTSATCQFADVEGAWSFAYINYVGQRNIMTGDGSGAFNPAGTLQIDEAIAIAVKASSIDFVKEVTDLNNAYKPSYWATYWISVAESKGLLDGIEVFDYTASCSRAMMAQIAYNMLSKSKDIKAGFDLVDIEASMIVSVADGSVVLESGEKIAVAASLVGYEIDMTWSKVTGKIYDLSVNTSVATATYADAAVKNVYDADNKLVATKIAVAGVEYIVGVEDSTTATDVIGGADTEVKGIALTIDGKEIEAGAVEVLPKYFKALGYDDNGDGDYERLDLTTYELDVVKLEKTTDDGVAIYSIDGVVLNKDEKTAVNWTGASLVADNETPMLVQTVKDGASIDVLEVAAVVTGKLTAISTSAKYVTVAGTKYEFENDACVVDTKTLNQTVSIYTIGGKYVKVASVSFSDITVIVDKAVVNEAGNVVLVGFDASNYANVEIELTGAKVGGKYVSYKGHYEANANDTDSKKYDKLVTLGGTQKDDGSWNADGIVTFAEGAFYKLNKSADGIYFEAAVEKTIGDIAATDLVVDQKLKVDGSYVYVEGVAQYYNDGAVILTEVVSTDAEVAKNAYYVTYTKADSFAEKAGVTAKAVISEDKKVSFIYITNAGKAEDVISTMKALAEGQTIVQVLGAYVEAGYDYFVYDVVDLVAGTKTTVKSASELAVGGYYVAAEGVVVEATTDKWMMKKDITVTANGLIKTITAFPTVATKVNDGAYTYANGEKALEYGLDMIKVYTAGDDGIIDIKDGAPVTAAAGDVVTATLTGVYAYVIEGVIILVK